MNREQKMAWLCVILSLTGLLIGFVVFVILYFKIGMPKALLGFTCICIAGFAGFGPLIFKKDKGKIPFDERDVIIKNNAKTAGFTAAYVFITVGCMITWFIIGPDNSISVNVLPNICIFACLTHAFVYSVAILTQYSRGSKDAEE